MKQLPKNFPYSDTPDTPSIAEIARARWGKTPFWESPDDLLRAFQSYMKWTDDNPVYVTEVVKNGMFAGTTYPVARRHLPSEAEFTSFIGAAPGYFTNQRKRYMQDWDDFKLDAAFEFAKVIDFIRETVKDEQDRGAASDQFNSNYIAKLRGLVDRRDVTTNGEAVKGALTVNVLEPRSVAGIAKLKSFVKDQREEMEAQEGKPQ